MHQNTQEPSRGRTKPGHPTVRSADQVSHSQEAHRRRVGSGSREGRGLSRFPGARFGQNWEYPRATAVAGEPEQGKEAFKDRRHPGCCPRAHRSLQQTVGRVDHRQQRLFSIRSTVYRILKRQGLAKSSMPRPLVLTRCGPLTLPTSESVDGASTTWLQ